jgi:hypothetical protein
VSSGAANPLARVEYALRSDEYLSEAQVRQIMEYYIAVRTRRFGRGPGGGEGYGQRPAHEANRSGEVRRPTAGSPIGAAAGQRGYTSIRPIGRVTGRVER